MDIFISVIITILLVVLILGGLTILVLKILEIITKRKNKEANSLSFGQKNKDNSSPSDDENQK